ncbi:uronyl 2-sulfotransferase-like isoform X2 [Apostichopus japonicus]|uniref:uronyl 2-sulfotransferase-like isoform X2 n=1 Tax=Stichopus japonicus TaxID=307972 RepID=UPI003AB8B799
MIITILYLIGFKPKQMISLSTGFIVFVAMTVTLLLGIHVTMNYSNTVNVKVAIIQNMDPRGLLSQVKNDDIVTSQGDEDDNYGSVLDSADDELTNIDDGNEEMNMHEVVGNISTWNPNTKGKKGVDHHPNNTPDTSYLYGKCITGRNHILLYNRVPKCGSRTLLSLTDTLAERYGYRKPAEIIVSRSKWQNKNMEVPYHDIVRKRLRNAPVTSVIHGHIYFIDFSRDKLVLPHKRPIYLNLIRDPFDRLVSQYYFVRFGDGKFTNLKQLHKMTHPRHINESFNDCVERDRPECIGPYVQSLMVNYFCGYGPECQQPTEGALEKAKQNVDKYVVVGVVEEYEDFLKVLEKLLPDFFGGILKEFKTSTERRREKKMKAKKKSPVTPEVKERITALLELDYKFYNHTRERFHQLKRTLGIE